MKIILLLLNGICCLGNIHCWINNYLSPLRCLNLISAIVSFIVVIWILSWKE